MTGIAAIMARVVPGTFVPDLGAAARDASEAPTIAPIPSLPGLAPGDTNAAPAVGNGGVDATTGATSFRDTVKALLGDVNDKLTTGDRNMRDLATGKTNDVNTVVTSVEEANLALQYTMAIRTKLLEAYTQVNQMAI